jgi:hypothetical protein
LNRDLLCYQAARVLINFAKLSSISITKRKKRGGEEEGGGGGAVKKIEN